MRPSEQAAVIKRSRTRRVSRKRAIEAAQPPEARLECDGRNIAVSREEKALCVGQAEHVAVHELMVQALIEHDRGKVLYALSLDPLTAAVFSLAEIESTFGEMWDAQRNNLGAFETKPRKVRDKWGR